METNQDLHAEASSRIAETKTTTNDVSMEEDNILNRTNNSPINVSENYVPKEDAVLNTSSTIESREVNNRSNNSPRAATSTPATLKISTESKIAAGEEEKEDEEEEEDKALTQSPSRVSHNASQGPEVDGGWGWVVVGCSVFISAVVDGMSYSLGILYNTFMTYFNTSTERTSLVSSLLQGIALIIGKATIHANI
jgi:hypothetical protein